jgi:hypothetical protein
MEAASAAVLAIVLAGAPGPVCRPSETDTATRPIPLSVAPAVIASFGVRMTPDEVVHTGVMRCVGGQPLACLVGANLNCGKADTRTSNAGASRWCGDHPNADFVPAFAAGHETIYAWRCEGARAVVERQVEHVDRQGFVAENWRRMGD